MLEAARILAGVSVFLLIVALVAWANSLGLSQLRRLDGSAANVNNPEFAALLLFAAVGLSAVAAILAVVGFAT
jgi:hypothetical protein